MNLEEAVLLTPGWSDQDFGWTISAARQIGASPEDLLAVWCNESKLDPGARDPRNPKLWPIAVGLTQFTRPVAAEIGEIPQEKVPGDKSNLGAWKIWADALLQRPVKDQIELATRFWLASPWRKAGKPFTSAAKLYQANAAPSTMFMGDDPKSVIFPVGGSGYEGNPHLRLTGDKRGITYGDLIVAVAYQKTTPIYQAALLRLREMQKQAGPW